MAKLITFSERKMTPAITLVALLTPKREGLPLFVLEVTVLMDW
jgi:hypothetical protein